MGCSSCGSGGGCGTTGGCKNSGLCASGSCNKMNSYDWISTLDYDDPSAYEYVEVSFKNGARKEFFKNPNHLITGDVVLVEVSGGGYDIGVISLSGDLVRLQMKKKYTHEDRITLSIMRRANERDLEKLENKTELERESMILSRAIAASLGLDIKIGDVEYQGDMKKATFFFTANGRVDFRELVRAYAKEFKVKIEMRQIGSRQESARIGGIGSCGRELCCSTWLSDFRSVNTTVARYQNIAINQTKLSGQCGRLKCCLNYELDAYVDALQHFPTQANHIQTKKGRASLVKTDIFKGLMFYVYEDISMRGVFHPLDKEKVKEILALNKKGVFPEDLTSFTEVKDEQKEIGYEDVTGQIELPNKKKKKKSKGGQAPQDIRIREPRPQQQGPAQQSSDDKPSENKGENRNNENRGNENRNKQNNNPRNQQNKQQRPQNSDANKLDEFTDVNAPKSGDKTPNQNKNNKNQQNRQQQRPQNSDASNPEASTDANATPSGDKTTEQNKNNQNNQQRNKNQQNRQQQNRPNQNREGQKNESDGQAPKSIEDAIQKHDEKAPERNNQKPREETPKPVSDSITPTNENPNTTEGEAPTQDGGAKKQFKKKKFFNKNKNKNNQ